jgi:hypothetical protein
MAMNRETSKAFKKWIQAEHASIHAFEELVGCVAATNPEKAVQIAEAVARPERATNSVLRKTKHA